MQTNRAVIDGLWRVLCPSIDAKFISAAIEPPVLSASRLRIGRGRPDNGWDRTRFPGQVRAVHSSRSVKQLSERPSSDATAERPAPRQADPSPRRVREENAVTAEELVVSKSDFPPRIHRASTPVIYEALRKLRNTKAVAEKIRRFVHYLVQERGERPNVFLYEALITANCDPTTGSASEVLAILTEMRTAGVEPSQGVYHSALRALAIHPDYLTRNSILRVMKKEKMQLKDEGKWSVALALLREDQYEMALEYLDEMCQDGTEIPEWVFRIFVYTLATRGFIDDAVQLLHQRLDTAEGRVTAVPLGVWYFLLDECSRSLHYEATRFIWEKTVQPGTLNPSDGIALNVLNTASRHGDSFLATQAIQRLSARRVKLGAHHYEAMLDCYVQTGDLENAFEVLCIMASAGVQPDQSSTRSIFMMLKRSPERADEAVRILTRLSERTEVPVAAINVLLESLAKATDMSRTLEVYRQVCHLCRSGPTHQTFSLLLEEADNAEAAVFLASEMDRFSITPSLAMRDNIVRCFARDGPLDTMFWQIRQMSDYPPPGWLSTRALHEVLERCIKEKESRVWAVVVEARKRAVDIDADLRKRLNEISQDDSPRQPAREQQVSDAPAQS
ncbi:hypothetical protein VTK56DRAFT_3943 [Thermocarpiscus australiensis]